MDNQQHYDTLLDKLADRLKIARHPDGVTTTNAALLLIDDILHRDASKSDPLFVGSIQSSKFTLDDVPLPKYLLDKYENQKTDLSVSSKEADVTLRRARCLKLLFLHDQRQLQSQVNQAILSIQSLTANPKTDSKQMALGR